MRIDVLLLPIFTVVDEYIRRAVFCEFCENKLTDIFTRVARVRLTLCIDRTFYRPCDCRLSKDLRRHYGVPAGIRHREEEHVLTISDALSRSGTIFLLFFSVWQV